MIPPSDKGLDSLFEPDSPKIQKQKEKKAEKPDKNLKKEKTAGERGKALSTNNPTNPKNGIVNQAKYAKKQAKRTERANNKLKAEDDPDEPQDVKVNPNIINFSNYVQTLSSTLFEEDLEETVTVEECVEKITTSTRKFPQSVKLPPELDNEGPTEYKLKLIDHSYDRMEHLVTQMKLRLDEGSGEAFYMIGYEDDGENLGIGREDTLKSLRNPRLTQSRSAT